MASASLIRLQGFFRTLFQFDLADLDFGLYRLFRLKQAAITSFIDEDLPRAVDDAFAHELAAENAHLHDELAAATTAIEQQLAADAILPTGELKHEYQQSQMRFVQELAARYETARMRVQAIQGEVWDEILINGDSAPPGVASLDPLFKRLMMGEGV